MPRKQVAAHADSEAVPGIVQADIVRDARRFQHLVQLRRARHPPAAAPVRLIRVDIGAIVMHRFMEFGARNLNAKA